MLKTRVSDLSYGYIRKQRIQVLGAKLGKHVVCSANANPVSDDGGEGGPVRGVLSKVVMVMPRYGGHNFLCRCRVQPAGAGVPHKFLHGFAVFQRKPIIDGVGYCQSPACPEGRLYDQSPRTPSQRFRTRCLQLRVPLAQFVIGGFLWVDKHAPPATQLIAHPDVDHVDL